MTSLNELRMNRSAAKKYGNLGSSDLHKKLVTNTPNANKLKSINSCLKDRGLVPGA